MDEEQPNNQVVVNLGGRPPHEPTVETRAEVRALARFGARHEDIAEIIGIHDDTLRKYYREELTLAKVIANSKVADSLYKKAVSDEHPQAATAAIFWLKTQAGWKERTVVEQAEDPAIVARRLELEDRVLQAVAAFNKREEAVRVREERLAERT